MRRLRQLVTLAFAATAVLAATASTAGAVTWHNSGDTAFTATGGATTATVPTFYPFKCLGSTTTGTTTPTPYGTPVWRITLTTTYSPCLSLPSERWECTRTFTALSQTAAVTTGTVDTTCGLWVSSGSQSAEICQMHGDSQGSYVNPTAPSTTGAITLAEATLLLTKGPTQQCIWGTGLPWTWTAHTLAITTATGGPSPHLGPIVTRTV